MRYFFITQDKNLPGSIQYRDFDINGSRHVFSKEDSSQLDSTRSDSSLSRSDLDRSQNSSDESLSMQKPPW